MPPHAVSFTAALSHNATLSPVAHPCLRGGVGWETHSTGMLTPWLTYRLRGG
jgi:hypothetical protein